MNFSWVSGIPKISDNFASCGRERERERDTSFKWLVYHAVELASSKKKITAK
jgi:hypothetical protein